MPRLAALALGVAGAAGVVMNEGGIPYRLSNPAGDGYPMDFEQSVSGPVDHFDVYGEVQTRYSQVYWTRNANIPLPPELVAKLKSKTIVITGYEVDQVVHSGPRPNYVPPDESGRLAGFSCYPSCAKGTDVSVPSYHAYNHHYFGWLLGADAEVFELEKPTGKPNPTTTGTAFTKPQPKPRRKHKK